ncbi:MAG: 50S ribosomal protein L3 [Planctomycetota bacterium]
MINGLIGKKLGMTQRFTDDGRLVGVTVVQLGPCVVTQVKTEKSDGYNAVQLGFGDMKPKNATKPWAGTFKKVNAKPARWLREFRTGNDEALKPGDVVKVDVLKGVKKVDIVGTSKGKGYQGVVKRYHKSRGPESHGSMNVRSTGSRSSSAMPNRVRPGTKSHGHMGDVRVTVKDVPLVGIDENRNLAYINGSVPGAVGALIMVRKSNSTK